jgi:uracil phosphoribosyltransferase
MQEHHYGPQVHLLDNAFLHGVLARLCSPETFQPDINRLVELLYNHLISTAVNAEFGHENFEQPTRMTEFHPDQRLKGHRLARDQKAVVVNLARAGTWPSHICYDFLHYALPAANIRQDHIMAARVTNDSHHVTGTNFGGYKIGGDVKNSFVIIPDPMGATGNTLVQSMDHYKKQVEGPARKFIALHLIVTPEYLKRVLSAHPDVAIYALRLDRGLSPRQVLEAPPGRHWDQEKGLNDKDYIVPGGGGFGEIMNNSFV